jgi:hypothetical protein
MSMAKDLRERTVALVCSPLRQKSSSHLVGNIMCLRLRRIVAGVMKARRMTANVRQAWS